MVIHFDKIVNGIQTQNTASTRSPKRKRSILHTMPSELTQSYKRRPYSDISRLLMGKDVFSPVGYMEKYVNANVINNAIKTNPNISRILAPYGLMPTISETNIDIRTRQHLFNTYRYAKEIAQRTNLGPKSSRTLCQAALVHDIGKALIPEEILQNHNKPTPEEKEIIDLHSILGYEILRTTNISEDVLKAIKSHHKSMQSKPESAISQILSVADVYSALREERVYKPAFPESLCFSIMRARKDLNQEYVDILQDIHYNQNCPVN